MSLESVVQSVADLLSQNVDLWHAEVGSSADAKPLSGITLSRENTDKFKEQLSPILDRLDVSFNVTVDTDVCEDTRSKIDAFNGSVPQSAADFALASGIARYANSVVSLMGPTTSSSAASLLECRGVSLSAQNVMCIEKLSLLLDLVVSLASNPRFASLKNEFYSILSTVFNRVYSLHPDALYVLWNYLEARTSLLSNTIFNADVTSNRIAILGLCNSLTDRYYSRNKSGKYDSYAKDSFDDIFHARVRTFLATLLKFDDSTGLNKYFATANRVNREPNLGAAKTGDDELLQDILSFHKLLRDPLSFLKSPRSLGIQADSLARVCGYLLEQELKYAKIYPPRDIHNVEVPPEASEREALVKKHQYFAFFPESYWLAPFEEVQRGAQFDEVKKEDQLRALAKFDSSKFRKLLIIQAYLICCFFIELQASRKKQVLSTIGAPQASKHITEYSTPDHLIPRFEKMKRDILRSMSVWDSQMSLMLQQLTKSEAFWWEWLIYGKLKDGHPLLSDKCLGKDDVSVAKDKFEKAFPLKTKRYFNSHGTPQLSRRMRAKTGLSLLKRENGVSDGLDEKIKALTEKINGQKPGEMKSELIEERTVLIWRKLQSVRESDWLNIDKYLNMEDLTNDADQKQPEPEKETEQDGEKNTEQNTEQGGKEAKHRTEPTEPEKDSHIIVAPIVGESLPVETNGGSESTVGEVTGEQMAKSRNLPETDEKTAGEVVGQSVAQSRKRERSPESDDEAGTAKKLRANGDGDGDGDAAQQ